MDGITDAQPGQKLNEKAWGSRAGSRVPTPDPQPPAAECGVRTAGNRVRKGRQPGFPLISTSCMTPKAPLWMGSQGRSISFLPLSPEGAFVCFAFFSRPVVRQLLVLGGSAAKRKCQGDTPPR